VAFADVAEHLMNAVSAERGARLSATVGRQRQLLSAVAAGQSLNELAARVSAETGHLCRVLTATGRQVVAGPTPMNADDVDSVTRAFLTADRLPVVTNGRTDTPHSVFTVGPALENRLTS